MKGLGAIVLLCTLALASVCGATDGSFDGNMAAGMAQMKNNDYPKAIERFREALAERPEDQGANLHLGIALSRANTPGADTALKRALYLAPDDPRTNLEMGIFYFNRNIYDEAGDYFENTAMIAPGSEFAATAEEYQRTIREKSAVKRWNLRLLTGMQYDSNVLLNADGSPLPENISHRSDWSGIFKVDGSYDLLRGERLDLTASYSLYQSLHTKLDDFDITQNLLTLAGKYRISSLLAVELAYSFEYLFLGGDAYDLAHSVTPSLVITEGEGMSTSIDYRFRDANYQNSPLFPDNSDRTGSNHQVGISQRFFFGGIYSARVSYAHDEESTRKSFWDYSGNQGIVELAVLLPKNHLLHLYGEICSRKYKGIGSFAPVERDDMSYTGSISATKVLSQRFALTAGYYYNRNKSNISVFDYKRSITSLLFNVRL